MAKKKAATKEAHITITPPNMQIAQFTVVGTAPYLGNKFSKRALDEMKAKMEAGSTAKKGKKRDAKDFKAGYKEAIHESHQGWHGIPAPGFRNAMISACKMAGFQMTRAKCSIFVEPDGFDNTDDTPLVKITKGKPKYAEHFVRNASGVCDLRPRPRWDEGWECTVTIRFDADQFTLDDVANLLARAGIQVGIGAGRPDSKMSNGMGWGTFKIKGKR
jgi:hypothetical protein